MIRAVTVEGPGPQRSHRLQGGGFRRLTAIWRSPPGQPGWARPLLLFVAALAGLAYAWGSNDAALEPFYGAAARSMSQSWHDFFFGAFDPLGTITVDKLPGALWLQAVSLRILGFHIWVVVLPQIVEGVLTVLVLYRAVQRLAGPVAGITAAIALAATPVTTALNRGNVSDSLLILLTVLAADATSAAIVNGRLRTLLLAGFWIGLAFQAKMLQAWFVAPALALPYLVSAPGSLKRRAKQLTLAGLLLLVVSLSWMSVVSLVPAHDRPYVDGSRNDSLFSQVFIYNGYARLGRDEIRATIVRPPAFLVDLNDSSAVRNGTSSIRPSWHRLLIGRLARDVGWFLPAALLAALFVMWDRRRKGRNDLRLAGLLLWSSWLLILGVSFSTGVYLNSYYVAALAPAIAAISGLGFDLYWRSRRQPEARAVFAFAIAATAGYGAFLFSGGVHVPGWVVPSCVAVAGLGIVALVACQRARGRLASCLSVFALTSLLPGSAVACAAVVSRTVGPFGTPYGPVVTSGGSGSLSAYATQTAKFLRELKERFHTPVALGVDTSYLAANFIFYGGQEVLPIGGYIGGFPSPTVRQIERYVATGEVRLFDIPVSPVDDDPRVSWIRANCKRRLTYRLENEVVFGGFLCAMRR